MSRWLILRTSGGRTLPLAQSLRDAGHDAWTPARTISRYMPAKTPSGKRRLENDVPVLPTFVFARERDLIALAHAATLSLSPHPPFSVFRHGGRVPLIADRDIVGLREEEQRAAATIAAIRAAETHEEAERIRIAAIRSEGLRRRAGKALERERRTTLRGQSRTFDPGTAVTVAEMPALAGVAGVVEANDRSYAEVRFGNCSWKIEGWRLSPAPVSEHPAPRGLAA